MPIGCCGNRVSLAGLLAEADFYPASSPQGRAARAKLAYGIAAGQAARVGNRAAYERAMKGLAGLGALGIFMSSDPVTAQRASTAVTTAVRTATTGVSIPAALSGASQYVNLVASVANLGTSIARSACNGCDTNAINAIDTVISWVRAILTGSAPTLPTLGPNELNGFVQFCLVKDAIWTILDPLMQAAVTGLRAGAIRDAGLGQAADVLDLIRQRIGTMFNGICTAIASQMPAPTPPTPGTSGCPANSTFDAASNTCSCLPGYSSAITPGQCVAVPTSPYRPGLFPGVRPISPSPVNLPPPPAGGPPAQPPKSSAAVVAIPAAIAAWWLFM